MAAVIGTKLRLVSHDVPAREARDRQELLDALISAPNFDPVLRGDVLRISRDHPHYGWGCQVPDCDRPRYEGTTMCASHNASWKDAKDAGVSKSQFLAQAVPLGMTAGRPRQRCRICPDRGASVQSRALCSAHNLRWKAAGRPLLEEWCTTQRPMASHGPCQVRACEDSASTPLGLCDRHHSRYRAHGRPGGARLDKYWARQYEASGRRPTVHIDDADAFREWCLTAKAVLVTGQISLEGLPKLVAAELKWGMFEHYQHAQPSHWSLGSIQRVVGVCSKLGTASFADKEDPRLLDEPSSHRMIFRGIRESLRKIYYTPEDTKEAGFLETEHFGRRFEASSSYIDLTPVPQQWLRDLLWDYLAAQLKSVKCPRTRGPFDAARRAAIQLGTFLAAEVPQADDDPTVLTERHIEAFVADTRHRQREGLPALGLVQFLTGLPSIVTDTTMRLTFTSGHKLLYWALESGQAELIGLPRSVIIAMPTGGRDPRRSRNPFSDDVARALADQVNLELLAATYDPQDYGLRDVWETLVFTGRRCSEVLKLRLDCTARFGTFPMLWHDQTKVGNYNEGVRIPDYLFERLEHRRQTTLARFEDMHGRLPTKAERPRLALFPSPTCNKNRRRSISYSFFQRQFSSWVDVLDLGSVVAHQARHTMATKLLRHGASLAHIRRYLGQVSDRMAEHYAKVATSEIEDVLQAVWVGGPGSATPGKLLSGDRPLTQHEAMALALDLSRRSTPAEGGFCTFQPVVDGGACPWNLDCENCDKFVLSGADLVYWRRKQQQWRSIAERAPDDSTADYLHKVFEPTARAIDGLERALAGLGLLDEALSLDLRRPQDYFDRVWSTAFRAADLARLSADDDADLAEVS